MNPISPETDPTLLKIQAAIRAAAERNDAAGMAAACLEHTRMVEKMLPDSPLDLLNTLGLESALQMADNTESPYRVLWYLLIMRQCLKGDTKNKIYIAGDILSRLIDYPDTLPLLKGAEGDNAVWLLVNLALVVGIEVARLARLVLDTHLLKEFYGNLFLQGGSKEFITLIQSNHPETEFDLLLKIAESQFRSGSSTEVSTTLIEAVQIVNNFSSAFSKVHGLLRISEVQRQIGDEVAAGKTLLESLEIADELEDSTKASVLPTIAMALSNIGQPHATEAILLRAAQVLAQSRSSFWIDSGLCKVAEAQVAAGMLAFATRTLNHIKDKDTREQALHNIVRREAQSGHFKVARWAVEHIRDTQQKVYSLSDIGSELAKTFIHTEEAEAIFAYARRVAGKIRNSEYRSYTFSNIARDEINAGYLRNAVETIKSVDDLEEKTKSQLMLAQAFINIEDAGEAMNAIGIAARTANLIEKPWVVKDMLNEIQVHLAQVQALTIHTDAVKETIGKIDSRGLKKETCSAVAQIYARRGQTAEAQEFTDAIEDAGEKVLVLSSLIKIYSQAGRKNEAEAAITQAMSSSLKIESLWRRSFMLMEIAKMQSDFGQPEVAERFLVAALKSVRNIEASWRLDYALERINQVKSREGSAVTVVKTLVSPRQFKAVNNSISLDPDPWDIADSLLNFACAEMMSGHFGKASDAFATAIASSNLIESEEWRTEAVSRIAWKQAESGQIEEAISLTERILTRRDLHLPRIIRAIAEQEARRENQVNNPCFKQMLVPCAYYLGATYEICGLLAELYPEQAGAIGRIVAASPL